MGTAVKAFACTAIVLALTGIALPAGGKTVTDALGREVSLSGAPSRIVSLAPNLTEILFELGLGDSVAGVTFFCDWPPEARAKPKIGGFINPSLEAVVALEPDLVLATADGNRPGDVEGLERLGLAVFVVDTRSFDDIENTVILVGEITGRGAAGRGIAEEMRRRRERVRKAVAESRMPTVFVALDHNPLITAAEGTFVDELITMAGGRNVVRSPAVKYPVYSLEQLFSADPEVVVSTARVTADAPEGRGDWWSELPGGSGLKAVRNGTVYVLGTMDFFRPGPRIVDSLERMARILHPEVFGK